MEAALYSEFGRLEDVHWWFTARRAIVREALSRRLPARHPRRILDVGCGTGGMLRMLREFGTVEGMDASDEALSFARARAGPDVPLHRGELPGGLPPARRYDLITAFDVIEHIPDAVRALEALRAALAPGGTLVCTVPAYAFLWSKHDELNHHCRRYTRRLLSEHLGRAGFEVRWASYFNTLLFPPIALARLAQRALGRDEAGSDLAEAPPLTNRLLQTVFASERFVVPFAPLPFGVSILAFAETDAGGPPA